MVISTISHFRSPALTTSCQSVFVSLFFMVYTLPTICGTNFFFISYGQGLGKFEISWRPSVFGEQYPFWEGGYAIIFHKASNDQSCKLINSRIFDGKIICVMCVGLLFSLVVENFPLDNFLSVHVSIQTLKKVFTIVW